MAGYWRLCVSYAMEDSPWNHPNVECSPATLGKYGTLYSNPNPQEARFNVECGHCGEAMKATPVRECSSGMFEHSKIIVCIGNRMEIDQGDDKGYLSGV